MIESYVSFIENFPRAEKVLDEISTKSSFQKFIEVSVTKRRISMYLSRWPSVRPSAPPSNPPYKDQHTFTSCLLTLQVCEREMKMRLPLKAHIVKPAQRIPRYELLIKVILNCLHKRITFCYTIITKGMNWLVMRR